MDYGALHDLKIIHRDIKCANIFLTKEGVVKLGDLNVSKVAKNGILKTQTGTPYYACPEVWNDKPYDYRSDIWSLGCVLYEMITLQPDYLPATRSVNHYDTLEACLPLEKPPRKQRVLTLPNKTSFSVWKA